MATYYDANIGAFIIDHAKLLSLDDRQAIRDDIDNQCGVGVVFVPGEYVPTPQQQDSKVKTNDHTKTPHVRIEFIDIRKDLAVYVDGKRIDDVPDCVQVELQTNNRASYQNQMTINTTVDGADDYDTINPNERRY